MAKVSTEYIYVVTGDIQLVSICDDCGPNLVPVARMEEIVRCRDCRFHDEEDEVCSIMNCCTEDMDFCCWGERRKDGEAD